MKARTLLAVLFSLVPAAALVGNDPDDSGRGGSVMAIVLNTESGVPLTDIPVSITSAAFADGTEIRLITGKKGTAEAAGLADGVYRAVVSYNNHQSQPVTFKIVGGNRAYVTILFNSDID